MKHEHALAALCAALAVSRSGDDRWKDAEPDPRARQDAQLSGAIRAMHREHRGVCGSRRVTQALRQCGLQPA